MNTIEAVVRRIFFVSLGLLLLAFFAQSARADNIDFACSSAASCSGIVTQSGSNYSSTGISVFNTTGPYPSSSPFMLQFDTSTNSISIVGTGALSGEALEGVILDFGSLSGMSSVDVVFSAFWGVLPVSVQNFLGTPQGMDTASVIYLSRTGAASSVDVFITPTPEPTSLALFGTGILFCAGLLRRRRKASA